MVPLILVAIGMISIFHASAELVKRFYVREVRMAGGGVRAKLHAALHVGGALAALGTKLIAVLNGRAHRQRGLQNKSDEKQQRDGGNFRGHSFTSGVVVDLR
jgi:hypothetical protein